MEISSYEKEAVQKITLQNKDNSYREKIKLLKKEIKNTNRKVKDSSKWYIIQLDEDIDLEKNIRNIESALKDIFCDNVRYFIPCYKEIIDNEIIIFSLFDGYIFIENKDIIIYNDIIYLGDNNVYGKIVRKNNKIAEVSGEDINKIKKDLWETFCKGFPKKGQIIVPKVGVFGGLQGEVVTVVEKDFVAIVKFTYSSIQLEVPVSFLNIKTIY